MVFLTTSLGIALATAILGAPGPNVLLLCVDDLKPALGCYGDSYAKTPHIDRLAARGLRLDRAYCNQAVCAPSRNALLAGLRPQTIGIYDLGTHFRTAAPDALTLPQYFKQNGYHTAAIGKIYHTGHGNQDDARSWSVPHFPGKGQTYALAENEPQGRSRGTPRAERPRGRAIESAEVEDGIYRDAHIADEAIRRLEAASENPDQPFFLAVGFIRPHLPFCAPKKYWDQYDASAIRLAELRDPPVGAPSYAPQFGGELRRYRDIPASGALPDALQRELIHGYYAASSYMDAQVGRVLDVLRDTGLEKNTIIVLWGDHGWHLGDHGMWCKHTNYEEAAWIPLLVAAPGQSQPGTSTATLVESVDLYPTLCELAGLPIPEGLDGRSFAQVVRDPRVPFRDSVIHVYPRGSRLGRAIRTPRYRLVEWKVPGEATETAELELYDYEADPLESKNLANDHPEVVAKLQAILAQHPEAKPSLRSVVP